MELCAASRVGCGRWPYGWVAREQWLHRRAPARVDDSLDSRALVGGTICSHVIHADARPLVML
jgi:hypothetical protein